MRFQIGPVPVKIDRTVGPDRDAAVGMRQIFALRVPVDAALGQRGADRFGYESQSLAQHRLADLAERLQAAERDTGRTVAEVVVMHGNCFREMRAIDLERMHRHQGAGVVRHVVASDLIRTVGQPARVARIRRTQEQGRRVDGASAQHEDVRRDPLDLPVDQHLDSDDAPAAVVGDQFQDLRAGPQFDVGMRHRRPDQLGFSIALGIDPARKRVAVLAALATPARPKIDGAGHRERFEAPRLQALFCGQHHRFMRYRRVIVILAARRIGRIGAAAAAYTE